MIYYVLYLSCASFEVQILKLLNSRSFWCFLQCVYPLGVTENSKLIVRRQVSEMSPQGRRKRKKKKQKQREEVVS